jgi:rhodanese-related sulfurtransferase
MNLMTDFIQRHLLALPLIAVLSVVAHAADYMSPGITPQLLLDKLDTDKAPLVVDVRKPVEFGVAHIPGAINIPVDEIENRLNEFKHNNGVLIYCINGSRTRQAEAILLGADIPNVYHLEGTFSGWIRDKRPIEKGGVKKSGW